MKIPKLNLDFKKIDQAKDQQKLQIPGLNLFSGGKYNSPIKRDRGLTTSRAGLKKMKTTIEKLPLSEFTKKIKRSKSLYRTQGDPRLSRGKNNQKVYQRTTFNKINKIIE